MSIDNSSKRQFPEAKTALGPYIFHADGSTTFEMDAATMTKTLGNHPEGFSDLKVPSMHMSSSFKSRERAIAEQSLLKLAGPKYTVADAKCAAGGGDAAESCYRRATIANGLNSFGTFKGSHHGQSPIATQLSGLPWRKQRISGTTLPVIYLNTPDCHRCRFGKLPETCNVECADEIEEQLRWTGTGDFNVSGVFYEPILGNRGGIVLDQRYLQHLAKVCRKHGIALIEDNVQTFARMGQPFGFQVNNIEPDMLFVAKGVTGDGTPAAGAVITTEEFDNLVAGENAVTSAGGPLAMIKVAKTCGIVGDSRFMESVRSNGDYLGDKLNRLVFEHECLAFSRGIGFMRALEVETNGHPDNKMAMRIKDAGFETGIVIRVSEYNRGASLIVRPPINCSEDELDDMCERLSDAITLATHGKPSQSAHVRAHTAYQGNFSAQSLP